MVRTVTRQRNIDNATDDFRKHEGPVVASQR